MFGLGPTELFIIALIVLLVFGAKRLPEIGKGLGGAIREFRKIKRELAAESSKDVKATGPPESGNQGDSCSKIEEKVKNKVLDQVPGVKMVTDAKKKVDKVNQIIK